MISWLNVWAPKLMSNAVCVTRFGINKHREVQFGSGKRPLLWSIFPTNVLQLQPQRFLRQEAGNLKHISKPLHNNNVRALVLVNAALTTYFWATKSEKWSKPWLGINCLYRLWRLLWSCVFLPWICSSVTNTTTPDCPATAKPQAPTHMHSSVAYQSPIPEQHGLKSNQVAIRPEWTPMAI